MYINDHRARGASDMNAERAWRDQAESRRRLVFRRVNQATDGMAATRRLRSHTKQTTANGLILGGRAAVAGHL